MDHRILTQVSLRRSGMGRRTFLRTVGGAIGLSALNFADLMTVHAEELRKRRMSCILLWMAGGPSQFETFDPKPDHANGAETPTIETAIPGVRIAKGWEKIAAAMGDIALIRSMTNKEGNHQRATYQVHTGYLPTGTLKHPAFGSNVAAELADPSFELPHIVSIGGRTIGSGFLGMQYEPFAVQNADRPPQNVEPAVTSERFRRRVGLIEALEDKGFARNGGYDRVKDHQTLYRQTANMILSPKMKVFDLDQESDAVQTAYGKTEFGRGCLLARRLVETGVPFVEVVRGGWDTHLENHERVGNLAKQVDPAMATLITDLKERGLLDSTLVVWMGEFGRTPKMNPRGGRDHYPRCFNVAVAGAGIKGGQVVGASSADGTSVKDRPVSVQDLLSSFCKALSINPAKENMTPVGRPIKIVDGGEVVKELFA